MDYIATLLWSITRDNEDAFAFYLYRRTQLIHIFKLTIPGYHNHFTRHNALIQKNLHTEDVHTVFPLESQRVAGSRCHSFVEISR